MNIPAAATQAFNNFKTKGNLGEGSRREAIDAEGAPEVEQYLRSSIDSMVSNDNKAGFDTNPAPGQVAWGGEDFAAEASVSGTRDQGQLTMALQIKGDNKTGVTFTETTPNGVLYCETVSQGDFLVSARALYLDSKTPQSSYGETLG